MRWLPTLIGSLGVAIPALLLASNLVLASAGEPVWHFGLALDGVMEPLDPILTVDEVVKRQFQGDAAIAIGRLVPVQRVAVRLKNQIWFALFAVPGTPGLVATRGRTLVEEVYLREYCSRDLPRFRAAAEAWIPQLRTMQDLVERRGQTFVYVLTPSKVAYDPALVPGGYPCPATAEARAGLLPLWRSLLQAAGIHVVDTTALIAAARPQYDLPLFPRGGAHWSMIGAALAAQAIGDNLNAQRHDAAFAPFHFGWTVTHTPIYPDDDLTLLMNLAWPDFDYPVPLVTFQDVTPVAPCPKVSVAMVGGSFLQQFAQVLTRGACRPHIDDWYYWQTAHVIWPYPGEIFAVATLTPEARRTSLLTADVVIYEENEQNMARSNHGPAFLAFLQAEAD